MKEVQFSHREGDYLILNDQDGGQIRIELSSELRQAVRHQSSKENLFSPGEVQALIRSGFTLEEVSEQLGVEADSIEPFAAPVIAELEYVKSAAMSVLVVAQDFDETVPFSELLNHKMGDVEIRVLKDSGVWILNASNENELASFSFDPKTNWLKPLDEKAREIFEEQSSPVPFSVIETVSEPESAEDNSTPNASSVATDLLEELQRRRAMKETDPEKPKPESSSKRPPLPSWDEIVFGAGEGKNEKEED